MNQMECWVSGEIMLGEYAHILGEILETHVDEDKADPDRRAGFNVSKLNPIVYFAEGSIGPWERSRDIRSRPGKNSSNSPRLCSAAPTPNDFSFILLSLFGIIIRVDLFLICFLFFYVCLVRYHSRPYFSRYVSGQEALNKRIMK